MLALLSKIHNALTYKMSDPQEEMNRDYHFIVTINGAYSLPVSVARTGFVTG